MIYKKIISLLYVLCTVSSMSLFAQYSSDPFATIYEDINYWHGKGYILHLPGFQPLPEVVLVSLMKQVTEKGDMDAINKAKKYLRELKKLSVYTTVSTFGRVNTRFQEKENTSQLYANGTLEGAFAYRISDIISVSGGLGGHILLHKDAEDIHQIAHFHYANKSLNRLEELEEVKVGTISNMVLQMSFSSRASFSAGTENAFLHAGFMRRSIGPHYDDGILVSPRAPQSANFFVYWRGKKKKLAATWGLFSLSSQQIYKKFSYDKDEVINVVSNIQSEKSYSYKMNKFFLYNSLTWYISDKINVSIYESVMFGNFNLGYILPIKMIYAIDSRSAFTAGNLLAGFHLNIRPIQNLTIPFSIAIDDISVSNYIKLNFYSKLKMASEVALQWNPNIPHWKELKLGYQIVTPYTYTHPPTENYESYSTAYNTENHTHLGTHLATSLQPSSHRIYASTDIAVFPFLVIGAFSKIEQHSNASDNILSGPLNDGSILDDGYKSVYDSDDGGDSEISFQERFDFLQGTVETKIESGINISFSYPLARTMEFFTDINYTYMYTINHNLSSEVRHNGIFQVEIGVEFLSFMSQ